MAHISIYVDDEVTVGKMTDDAIAGGWPLSLDITKYCGEGELRHVFQRDQVNLHGDVPAFRRFAQAILAALPAEEPVPILTNCTVASNTSDGIVDMSIWGSGKF